MDKTVLKPKLIFIGGCPRSGTSMVQRILNNHSLIYGGPEFDHIPNIMSLYERLIEGIENGRQRSFYNIESLRFSMRQFITQLLYNYESSNKEIIYLSEKTPDNIFVISQLREVFSDCKIIIVLRDPRSVLYSFERVKQKAKKENIEMLSFGANFIIDMLRINKSMSCINGLFKQDNLDIKYLYYEDIVLRPEDTLRELCNYLNLEFEESMLDLKGSKVNKDLYSNESVSPFITEAFSQNISDKSLDIWNSKMGKSKKVLTSFYFRSKGYPFLNRYNFSSQNKLLVFAFGIFQFLKFSFFSIHILITKPGKIIKYVAKNYTAK